MKPTEQQIEAAATAIANARGMRHGVPPVTNILVMLTQKMQAELREDAEEALTAAFAVEKESEDV